MTEIRIDVDFGHPPALVWRALTERRQLARWFMAGDLEAIAGSRFQLLPDALPGFDGPISGQVLEVSAGRRLVMRWRGEELHVRVTWEVKPTPEGCLLMVSQSGFLGVRGSARRQALVSTYDLLFSERLPAVLDVLAGKGDGVPARLPGPPARPSGPVAPVASQPDRRRQILAVGAGVLLIGLVAVLLANLPSETSAPAQTQASGTSGQPAMFASATNVATTVDASQRAPSAPPFATTGAGARPSTAAPSASSRAERSATSAPPPAALTATYATLPGGELLTYRGEVVVRNTGGTGSGHWTLTITVPLLAVVTGVEGPQPVLNGTSWTFSGASVPAGASVRVVFDVVLNVLGPAQPLSCQLGGVDCAGL